MNYKQIKHQLEQLVSEITEYEKEISEIDNLEHIGITSLNFIILIMKIEEKFLIEFEDSDINFNIIHTFDDLINYIIIKRGEKCG